MSTSDNTDELAEMPVRCSMAEHSARSESNPSQPAEVPFQQITSTRASASSAAASSLGPSSNCASARSLSAISVTRKRLKCAETWGASASMAKLIGSSTVFDEGVSIPSRTRSLTALSPSLFRHQSRAAFAAFDRCSSLSRPARFDNPEGRRKIDHGLGGVGHRQPAQIARKMASHDLRRRLCVALSHQINEPAVIVERA